MGRLTAAQAEAEIRRSATDPLSTLIKHYEPSPTQAAFHARYSHAVEAGLPIPYNTMVTGGGRSGKTTACLVDLAWCLRGIHPRMPWRGPFTALVFCISRQQAAMVAGKKLFEACEFRSAVDVAAGEAAMESGAAVPEPIYPDIPASPLIPGFEIASLDSIKVGFRSIQHAKLHNGCEVYFSWSDVEETWKRIQGPKIGYVYIDENAGSKKLLIEASKRVSDSQHPGSWHGQLVWGGHGTEDNEAFDEFRARCEDPKFPDHAFYRLLPGETGAVTQAAIDRFAATLTEEERRIHITGETSAGGLVRVYGKQWSDERHMLPVDRVVREDDNLWVGYDPGVEHPMGMMVIAVGRDAPTRLVVTKCWTRKGGTIDDDIRALRDWLRGRKLTGFVYDTNLKNKDRGGGPSVLAQFKEKMAACGLVPMNGYWQSKKNHATGVSLVRTLLELDLVAVNPSDESGGRLFQIEMKKLKGHEAKRFTGEGGIIKKDDALHDAFRYTAMQRPGWSAAYACGLAIGEVVVENGAPVAVEQTREQRMVELSTMAASFRSRGRSRVRGFGARETGEDRVPMWMRRRDGVQ